MIHTYTVEYFDNEQRRRTMVVTTPMLATGIEQHDYAMRAILVNAINTQTRKRSEKCSKIINFTPQQERKDQ